MVSIKAKKVIAVGMTTALMCGATASAIGISAASATEVAVQQAPAKPLPTPAAMGLAGTWTLQTKYECAPVPNVRCKRWLSADKKREFLSGTARSTSVAVAIAVFNAQVSNLRNDSSVVAGSVKKSTSGNYVRAVINTIDVVGGKAVYLRHFVIRNGTRGSQLTFGRSSAIGKSISDAVWLQKAQAAASTAPFVS